MWYLMGRLVPCLCPYPVEVGRVGVERTLDGGTPASLP